MAHKENHAMLATNILLCIKFPLDVSSPLILAEEEVEHDSRWLVAEDGIGKWSLILLVSKQELIQSVKPLRKALLLQKEPSQMKVLSDLRWHWVFTSKLSRY